MLTDARFHNSLFDLDRLIAEQVRQKQCRLCHGNLHQSHFLRKPRGLPEDINPDYSIRFSYCCGTEGCRKRFTAPSMRFLSRKVYSSIVIILIFLLKPETDESRIEKINTLLGTTLSIETLRRWRHFWIKDVPQTHAWKRLSLHRSHSQELPVSLLMLFEQSGEQALKMGLKLILPLTAGVHLFDVPFRLNDR
ncbi:MAG: hypothetical protein ABFS32_17450 [Bacteroidota bacterium]